MTTRVPILFLKHHSLLVLCMAQIQGLGYAASLPASGLHESLGDQELEKKLRGCLCLQPYGHNMTPQPHLLGI